MFAQPSRTPGYAQWSKLVTSVIGESLRLKVLFPVLLILVSCSGSAADETTTVPPPATQAEMEVFCARFHEVKDQSDKWAELEKVAPAEIKGALFRLANGPSEGYWDDRETVEEFETRCDE